MVLGSSNETVKLHGETGDLWHKLHGVAGELWHGIVLNSVPYGMLINACI